MINRSQLGRTTMVDKFKDKFKDKLKKSRIDRASRSNPAKAKKSRKTPQKPSYLSTPTQQLGKALSKAKKATTPKGGPVIDVKRFLSKAENQRSRLGLGEAKNVGKKFTVKDRPGKKTKSKKLMEKLGKRGTRKGLKNGKLVGGQKKLDANKDGKISKVDFALLKKKKTTKSA